MEDKLEKTTSKVISFLKKNQAIVFIALLIIMSIYFEKKIITTEQPQVPQEIVDAITTNTNNIQQIVDFINQAVEDSQ